MDKPSFPKRLWRAIRHPIQTLKAAYRAVRLQVTYAYLSFLSAAGIRLIGEFPPEAEERRVFAGRLLYVVRRAGKNLVCYGGKEYGLFDHVRFRHVDAVRDYREAEPIDRSLVFTARRDGRWWVFIDGVEHGPHDYQDVSDPIVIGGKPCFVAHVANAHYVVCGDERYGPFHKVVGLKAADGTCAYAAKGDGGWVTSGVDIAPYEVTDVLGYWEKDGTTTVLAMREGHGLLLVGNNVLVLPYQKLSFCTEVDGEPLFIGRRDAKRHVWWQGNEGPAFDRIDPPSIVEGRLLYTARRGKEWFVVLDGAELGPYQVVEHMSYARGKLLVVGIRGDQRFVHRAGAEEGPYPHPILHPVLVDDWLLYVTSLEGKQRVVLEGRVLGGRYDAIHAYRYANRTARFHILVGRRAYDVAIPA